MPRRRSSLQRLRGLGVQGIYDRQLVEKQAGKDTGVKEIIKLKILSLVNKHTPYTSYDHKIS